MQGIHDLYTDNQNIKLSEWMIVTGTCAWLFTMLVGTLLLAPTWKALLAL